MLHRREIREIELRPLVGSDSERRQLFLRTARGIVRVGRSLDPELDMWRTAEPVVREWIESHLGPAGVLKDTAGSVGALGRLVRDLPERAEKISAELEKMGRDGLRFDGDTAEAIGRSEAKHTRSGRIAMWVAAIALAVIAYKMSV